MGFLSEILGEVAKEVAVSVGADALGAAADAVKGVSERTGGILNNASEAIKMRKTNDLDRYQQKMEKKNPENLHIWLIEHEQIEKKTFRKDVKRKHFRFLNPDGQPLYSAVYTHQNRDNILTLYDNYGYEVGGIIGNLTNKKTTFSVKNDDTLIELEMFYKNQPVGVITNNTWKGSWLLSWDVSGWGAQKKKVGQIGIVSEKNEIVAEITTKTFNANKLTFIDIASPESEAATILFTLATLVYDEMRK